MALSENSIWKMREQKQCKIYLFNFVKTSGTEGTNRKYLKPSGAITSVVKKRFFLKGVFLPCFFVVFFLSFFVFLYVIAVFR